MGWRQVCELTPGGRGAVCVLQLRADNVAEVVQDCFRAAGKRPLPQYPFRQPVYGYWTGVAAGIGGPADSQSSEDVVTCRQSVDVLEVHCHGGEFAKRRIIESLRQLDFEVVAWRDWYESNEKSSIVIAASRMLPLTQTIKTASVVNWQVSERWIAFWPGFYLRCDPTESTKPPGRSTSCWLGSSSCLT